MSYSRLSRVGAFSAITNLRVDLSLKLYCLGPSRIGGQLFGLTTTHVTLCSFATPFKVGVHFDADESIQLTPASTAALSHLVETHDFTGSGGALGIRGFYLNYFQVSC